MEGGRDGARGKGNEKRNGVCPVRVPAPHKESKHHVQKQSNKQKARGSRAGQTREGGETEGCKGNKTWYVHGPTPHYVVHRCANGVK